MNHAVFHAKLYTQPPSGGCVLKHPIAEAMRAAAKPAAFGRLCVETHSRYGVTPKTYQPPSGGCVLKQDFGFPVPPAIVQPPSGGCVLKRVFPSTLNPHAHQPPSGGCVLKRRLPSTLCPSEGPAAFGRLCVETSMMTRPCLPRSQPPSGGCVLKPVLTKAIQEMAAQPPSGGCVLKPIAH